MKCSCPIVLICGSKLFLYILCVSVFFVVTSVYAGPRLQCDSPKYDFGIVMASGAITNEFILVNNGNEPVIISKVKDCCGVVSTIMPKEILPGSNAVCRSVFTTRSRYGKQDKQILVASNDRKHPYFELKMVGMLLKPVDVTPRIIRLGTLLQDCEFIHVITATNLLERKVDLQAVSSGISGISAEIAGGLADPASESRNWTIQMMACPPLAIGKLRGSVQLKFSSGTVDIPVLGTVEPVVAVVPDQIRFSSQTTNEVKRLVMMRSGDGRPFTILSANLENAEGSVELEQLSDDRWRCKLSIDPSSLVQGSVLRITTSLSLQPKITVPLTMVR